MFLVNWVGHHCMGRVGVNSLSLWAWAWALPSGGWAATAFGAWAWALPWGGCFATAFGAWAWPFPTLGLGLGLPLSGDRGVEETGDWRLVIETEVWSASDGAPC